MRTVSNGLKTDIINYFKVQLKGPKSPSVLRISTYANTSNSRVKLDLIDPVCTESAMTYLYLIVDVSPDRDYMERYRVVLSRLFSSIKATDPQIVILPHKSLLEQSNNKRHYSRMLCIDQLSKISRPII